MPAELVQSLAILEMQLIEKGAPRLDRPKL